MQGFPPREMLLNDNQITSPSPFYENNKNKITQDLCLAVQSILSSPQATSLSPFTRVWWLRVTLQGSEKGTVISASQPGPAPLCCMAISHHPHVLDCDFSVFRGWWPIRHEWCLLLSGSGTRCSNTHCMNRPGFPSSLGHCYYLNYLLSNPTFLSLPRKMLWMSQIRWGKASGLQL